MLSFYLLLADPDPSAREDQGAQLLGPCAYVQREGTHVVTVGLSSEAWNTILGDATSFEGIRELSIPITSGRLQIGGQTFGSWAVIDEDEKAALQAASRRRPNDGARRLAAFAKLEQDGDWAKTVAAILKSDETDLRRLAEIANLDPATLYAHSDLSGCDLRGMDLTGMTIGKLDRSQVLFDERTIWPDGTRGAQ